VRFSTILVAWLCVVATGAAQTPAPPHLSPIHQRTPEPGVTWGGEVDSSSRYVWRGLPYSEGAVVWPSAWISGKGFTFSLWVNADHRYRPRFNEYDVSAAYERTVGRLTVTGTFSRYTYREVAGDPGSTSEAVVRAVYSIGPGEAFATSSFDVEKYRGAYYVDFGYAVDRDLSSKSLLKLDASVALWTKFAEKYGVPSDGPLGPATVNVALVQKLTAAFAVRPHVTFTRLLDPGARHALRTPWVTYGVAVLFGQ